MNEDPLREKLAAIEHERWSHWQQWMHGQGWPDKDGNLVIAKAQADAWSRQYHTAYADLTDAEKASDMEQVDRYWPLIAEQIEAAEAVCQAAKELARHGENCPQRPVCLAWEPFRAALARWEKAK